MMIITPEKGMRKEIGQQLFALVAQLGLPASTVQWVTWPKAGYQVPLELFYKFDTNDAASEAVNAGPDEELTEAAPLRKPRGRPRKTVAVEGADNNTISEEG